jgi:hypothetical protein
LELSTYIYACSKILSPTNKTENHAAGKVIHIYA